MRENLVVETGKPVIDSKDKIKMGSGVHLGGLDAARYFELADRYQLIAADLSSRRLLPEDDSSRIDAEAAFIQVNVEIANLQSRVQTRTDEIQGYGEARSAAWNWINESGDVVRAGGPIVHDRAVDAMIVHVTSRLNQ